MLEACATLIRFDTSNFGGGDCRGETEAAEWVAGELRDCGYEPSVIESAPGRGSTVVRIPGADPTLPALLVHGHLDVVPADADKWSADPFGGEIRDGCVWGRGALDMKGMDAMMLAVAQGFARDGVTPPRDIVLAFVADEEDGGEYGAGYIVRHQPELLSGVAYAIGESGGTQIRLPDGSHLYPVAAAERGTAWIELTAYGTAGHGSRPRPDNAVGRIAETVAALGRTEWPVQTIPAVEALIGGLSAQLGVEIDPTAPDLDVQLGAAARLVSGVLRHTLSPTMLTAGYKANVVPSKAVAVLDGRIVPGFEDEFLAVVDAALAEGVTRSFLNHQASISSDHRDPELELMERALRVHDPGALVLPCCARGGTDAKWWSRLGIACYGFAPELTAPGEGHDSLVHGVDERISVQSLTFGAGVLDTYLRTHPSHVHSEEEEP